MSDGGPKIIVVKKKVKGHGGHHGGSWKVAYADFVTAMMAFFLVMWIMGMDSGARDMVQGYFLNPVGFKKAYGGGKNILSKGNTPAEIDMRTTLLLQRQQEFDGFEAVKGEIEAAMAEMVGEGADVEVVITDEGLRIELMDTGATSLFFESASAELKADLTEILNRLGGQLAALPNPVVIEGHTDSATFGGAEYTNWELSVDRANAARRQLIAGGLPADRVIGVRGLADRQLKDASDAYSPRNRRVTLLLNYSAPDPNDPDVMERLGLPVETTTAASLEEIP